MALLYRDKLQKRSHYAPLCSKTSCIYFVLVLICIILPFLLVIRTYSKLSFRRLPIFKMAGMSDSPVAVSFANQIHLLKFLQVIFSLFCILMKVKSHLKSEEDV